MLTNIYYTTVALARNIQIYFINIVRNHGIIGFFSGIVVALLITGFIITENPKHIPLILRYSSAESFRRIALRDKRGTYLMPFSSFLKLYAKIRILFFCAIITFFLMIGVISLFQK